MIATAYKRLSRLLHYTARAQVLKASQSLPSLVNLLFSPFAGLHYLRVYLALVRRLGQDRGSSSSSSSSRSNAPALFTFRAVNSLVLFKAAHFLYLGVVGRQFSDAQRLLHYDAVHLLVPNRCRLNVFACLVGAVVLVYNYLLLLLRRPQVRVLHLLGEVLLLGVPGFRKDHDKSFSRHFLFKFYRRKEVTQLIRRFFLLTLKSFHQLLVVIDALLLYVELTYAHQIAFHYLPVLFQPENWCPQFLGQILLLIAYHSLAGTAFAALFLNLAHIFTIYYAISATLIAILYLQLKQMITFLQRSILISQKHQHFSSQFSHFQRRYAQAIVLLGEINQACNGCFLAFLLVAFPLNATFLSWLIGGQVKSLLSQLIIGSFIVYQWVVIMLIHLALTVIIGLVDAPGKVLKSASVLFEAAAEEEEETNEKGLKNGGRHQRRRTNVSLAKVRTKLHLALQIFAIDSRRKLGFTYGPIGLISLAAFVRFLILYSKTAMIIYKQTQLQ